VIGSAAKRPISGQDGLDNPKSAPPVAKDLTEVAVAPDSFQVSPEPLLLTAELTGALALCMHDEGRRVGGLLHLRFKGGSGRPSDVTDNTLSSVLVILDRFKRAVAGNSAKRDCVHARIIAHALPPTGENEPSATLVDLLKADFADGSISCGTQTVRRIQPVRVCFEPVHGRIWIAGPSDSQATARASL
jgi:hypothetical protein